MRLRDSRWGQLELGSYMKDKTGQTWKVIATRPDGHLGIENRDGERAILKPRPADSPVVMVVPTTEEAVANIAAALGGTVIKES